VANRKPATAVKRQASHATRIAGMTDAAYMPFEPDRVCQFLTGTRMDCRGRGLAKWLKAAMLLFVRNAYPDVQRVITENASSNAGMPAISNRLSIKKHRGGSGYQLERSRLADLPAAEGIAWRQRVSAVPGAGRRGSPEPAPCPTCRADPLTAPVAAGIIACLNIRLPGRRRAASHRFAARRARKRRHGAVRLGAPAAPD